MKTAQLALTAALLLMTTGCVIQIPSPESQITREDIEAEIQAEESADSLDRLTETCNSVAEELDSIGQDLPSHFDRLQVVFAENPDTGGLQMMAGMLANDARLLPLLSGSEYDEATLTLTTRTEEFMKGIWTLCGWQ